MEILFRFLTPLVIILIYNQQKELLNPGFTIQ